MPQSYEKLCFQRKLQILLNLMRPVFSLWSSICKYWRHNLCTTEIDHGLTHNGTQWYWLECCRQVYTRQSLHCQIWLNVNVNNGCPEFDSIKITTRILPVVCLIPFEKAINWSILVEYKTSTKTSTSSVSTNPYGISLISTSLILMVWILLHTHDRDNNLCNYPDEYHLLAIGYPSTWEIDGSSMPSQVAQQPWYNSLCWLANWHHLFQGQNNTLLPVLPFYLAQ